MNLYILLVMKVIKLADLTENSIPMINSHENITWNFIPLCKRGVDKSAN